jgi:hypothetical protein
MLTAMDALLGHGIRSRKRMKANQTLEPTTTAVTPRADARVAPSVVVAHL